MHNGQHCGLAISVERYAQAGDLPGADDVVDAELLRQLVIANRGKRVIAFTHKPVLPDTPTAARNRYVIAAANNVGFTVNLSANTPAEADRLADLAIAQFIQAITQCSAQNHRAQSISGARRLAKFSLTFDYVAGSHAFENTRSVRAMASMG